MKRLVLAAVLFAAAATPAAAYTSYVKPEEFWVTDATTQATNQSAATPLRDMQRLSVRLSPRSVDVDVARPHDVSLSLLPRKRFPD